MKLALATVLLVLSVSPEQEKVFHRLQEMQPAELSGKQVECLVPVLAQFDKDLQQEALLLKRGRKLGDFTIFVMEEGTACVVEISAKAKKTTGGGIQYWVHDGKVVNKFLAK